MGSDYGFLVIDNDKLNPVSAGSKVPFKYGTQHTSRTNELPFLINFSGTDTTQKFNKWYANSPTPDYNLQLTFTADSLSPATKDANFNSTVITTLKNNLPEVGMLDPINDKISFKDPWFYFKDGNNNWFQSNIFKEYSSPFNILNSSNESYGGVFLNQGYNPITNVWSPPYYSVRAISPQAVTINGRTHNFYFQNWDYDTNKISLQYPSSLETGIVFKDANATLSANMKGTQLSNDRNAYANNSQRKFVTTSVDNYTLYYNTYTSMNKVWLERNYGDGWQIMNNGKPLSNNESKNPSIDYWQRDAHTSYVFVVNQEKKSSGGYKIMMKIFHCLNEDPIATVEVVDETTESYLTDANPVIAIGKGFDDTYKQTIMVCWYKKNSSYDRPSGLYVKYGHFNPDNRQFNWLNHNLPIHINGTNTNSIKPSLAAPKQITLTITNPNIPFHLVYEESNQIKYHKIMLRPNGSYSLFVPENISKGSGYTKNYSPSIISLGESSSVISWIGERYPMAFSYYHSIYDEKHVVFINQVPPNRFWTFGVNVNSTSINKINNAYAIAWASDNNTPIKYTHSKCFGDIYSLGITGKDVQLCNGTTPGTMYALAYNTGSQPYYMRTE